jgi:hypothetical protein
MLPIGWHGINGILWGVRKALGEAEKVVLPAYAKPFLLRARGWICDLEQNQAGARKAFAESIEYMERTRNLPIRDGSIAVANVFVVGAAR